MCLRSTRSCSLRIAQCVALLFIHTFYHYDVPAQYTRVHVYAMAVRARFSGNLAYPNMDKFIKSIQKREEERAKQKRAVPDASTQCQQFLMQFEQMQFAIEQMVQDGRQGDAQGKLNTLRALVQDTASSVSLTAFDMAKTNSTLARLQRLLENATTDANAKTAPGGNDDNNNNCNKNKLEASSNDNRGANDRRSSGVGGAQSFGGRPFRFATKLKSKSSSAHSAAIASPVLASAVAANEREQQTVNSNDITSATASAGKTEDGGTSCTSERPSGAARDGKERSYAGKDRYGPANDDTLFVNHAKAVFVQNCQRCTILSLPIAGSVFVTGCIGGALYLACHQLRLKDCRDMEVYVWCASTPIIENCNNIRFGPYTCWTGLLRSCMPAMSAGEVSHTDSTNNKYDDNNKEDSYTIRGRADGRRCYSTHEEWVTEVGDITASCETRNNYTTVHDFQWIKKMASPHWRVLRPEEQRVCDTLFVAPTDAS